MNKDKLLALFMGKCWHEDMGNSICKICGSLALKSDYPDFSQPAQWHEFFVWLTKEREDMWTIFYRWAWIEKQPPNSGVISGSITWLFSDLSRFRDLFADFLCLPETIEWWGIIECEDNMAAYPHCVRGNCDCDGTGKILTPWARYASEKPVHISDKNEATDEQG